VIRLAGIPVQTEDARSLVATLLADDHPHGSEAAARIAHALEVDAAVRDDRMTETARGAKLRERAARLR
jgi:hypothetical protein